MPRTSLMMRGAAEKLVREREIVSGHLIGRGHRAQIVDRFAALPLLVPDATMWRRPN
jgi:hypothetical protein